MSRHNDPEICRCGAYRIPGDVECEDCAEVRWRERRDAEAAWVEEYLHGEDECSP